MRAGAISRLMTLVSAWRRGAERSEAFEAFRYEFFEDATPWRDGFDLDLVRALQGHERRLAENMLIDALPDARALLGLSALATPRAKRRLERIFAREAAAVRRNGDFANGGLMIAAASALWAISPQPRYANAVAERLRLARAASERRDAAAALAEMPCAEIEDALDGALDDIDALVRHHAARALLGLYGAPVDATGLRALAQRIVARRPRPAPLRAYRESPGAVM